MFLSKGIIRSELYFKKMNLFNWKRKKGFVTTLFQKMPHPSMSLSLEATSVSRAGVQLKKLRVRITRLIVLQKITLLIYC